MATLTYKYAVKGKRSVRLLRRYAFSVNQVWNFCVETQRKVQRNYRDGLQPSWPSQYDLQHLTASTSRDLRLHAQSVQDVCAQFVRSRDLHKTYPRFRRSGKGPKRSLGWVPFQAQSRRIGPSFVRYLGHDFHFFGSKRRPLEAVTVKGGCFVEDARGCWWVCLHVIVPDDKRSGIGAVGIDLGLKTLGTLSTGSKIEPIRSYRTSEAKLATAQRANNKRRIRALHAKIANVRRDYLHKQSTRLIQQFGAIYVGNVARKGLGKTKFAKSALDAGLSTFCNMLRYKASRHGAYYAEVDERFTTQICSKTGTLPPERPKGIADLGIREWWCSACGEIHDRDVNAAQNILTFGLSAQPPVVESRAAHGR